MSPWLLAAGAAIVVGAIAIQLRNSNLDPSTSPDPTVSPLAEETATPDTFTGWDWFSDPALGLSFRYPSEWGDPAVTREAGTAGSQFRGSFGANAAVTFGGNSADYKGPSRGATLFDFYGFAAAGSGTYAISFAPGKTFQVQGAEVLVPDPASAIVFTDQSRSQVYGTDDVVAYANTGRSPFGAVVFRYADAPEGGVAVLTKLIGTLGGTR